MTDLRTRSGSTRVSCPAPRHDLDDTARHGRPVRELSNPRRGGDYNPHGNYDVNRDGVFNVLDYACDSRVAAVVSGGSRPPRPAPRTAGLPHPRGPDPRLHRRASTTTTTASPTTSPGGTSSTTTTIRTTTSSTGTAPARPATRTPRRTTAATRVRARTAWSCRCGSASRSSPTPTASRRRRCTRPTTAPTSIQEALGTLNAPQFAAQAIEYAYHHGVAVIASAADEAAEHHNQPGSLPDTIVVNSVTKYDSTLTSSPPSYLQLNGCTNFGTRIVALGAEQLVLLGGDGQERGRRGADLQRRRGRRARPIA